MGTRRMTASWMSRASSIPSMVSSSMPASRRARSTSVAPFLASRTALVAMARYASTFARSISARKSRSAAHAGPIDAGASRPVWNTSDPKRTGARSVATSRHGSRPSRSGKSGSCALGPWVGADASTIRRRSAFDPTSMAAKRGMRRKLAAGYPIG
jgi:hypothetical protein